MFLKELEDQYHSWDFSDDKKFRTHVSLGIITIARILDKIVKPLEADAENADVKNLQTDKKPIKKGGIGSR